MGGEVGNDMNERERLASLKQLLEVAEDAERRAASDLIMDLPVLRRLVEVEPGLVHLLDSAEKVKAARDAYDAAFDEQLAAKRQGGSDA